MLLAIAGRPLDGPRPGAIGVKAHHVFQVIRVVDRDHVLAISGNDHNDVRTRIRPTSDVIGWRDVTEENTASDKPAANTATAKTGGQDWFRQECGWRQRTRPLGNPSGASAACQCKLLQ
jgi:hypothetical protein